MKNGLVVTNYNNFKDLSYFIGQHKQALRMIEEVNNFYLSFLKSKLIHSYEISKWPGNLISCKSTDKVSLYLSKYSKNKSIVKEINGIISKKAEELHFKKIKTSKEENEACAKIIDAIEEEFVGKEIQFTLPDNHGFPTLSKVKGTIIKLGGNRNKDNIIDTYSVELSDLIFSIKLKKPVKEYVPNFYDYARWDSGWESTDFMEVVKSFDDKEYTKRFDYRISKSYKKICELPNGQQILKERLEKSFKKNKINWWFIEKDHMVIPFSSDEDLGSYKFEIKGNPLVNIKKGFKDSNEYLVVSTTSQSSGNTTDRWKTFYEEKEHLKALLFDISTGNLTEAIDTTYITHKHELNVDNGWHPYDDD